MKGALKSLALSFSRPFGLTERGHFEFPCRYYAT